MGIYNSQSNGHHTKQFLKNAKISCKILRKSIQKGKYALFACITVTENGHIEVPRKFESVKSNPLIGIFKNLF